jgi:hypothetical protein
MIGFDDIVTRYESDGALVSLAAGRGGLVGIRCDRPGQGRRE